MRRFAEREQVTSTAFITHRDCQLHDMGSHHPECPQRLTAINDHLIAQGIDAYFDYYDAPLATFEQLLRVHPAAHLERIKRASPEMGIVHLDPDTAMNPHTWQAALRARPGSRVTLPEADHTCSTPGSQLAMESATCRWLAQAFAPRTLGV